MEARKFKVADTGLDIGCTKVRAFGKDLKGVMYEGMVVECSLPTVYGISSLVALMTVRVTVTVHASSENQLGIMNGTGFSC